ncbi:MAG: hypothetical protein BGO39_26255 [Chloroflexi bacterium 54-19]|nr:MAG: hypothetical protein BGO39_26255 [Chloroflexi bacterium 54-19]
MLVLQVKKRLVLLVAHSSLAGCSWLKILVNYAAKAVRISFLFPAKSGRTGTKIKSLLLLIVHDELLKKADFRTYNITTEYKIALVNIF